MEFFHSPRPLSGMKDLWLPRTVLEADFLVSMPKIKTHHWSGVTLSMKNMFGVVPGHEIRMAEEHSPLEGHPGKHPRSVRHRSGPLRYRGRDRGDGRQWPAQRHRSSPWEDRAGGRSGSCRCNLRTIDGIRSRSSRSHSRGLKILGNASPALLDQVGELADVPVTPFEVVPEFQHLQAL